MIKVLIVDDNLDSHELLNDVLHINFQEVEIERAHDSKSFISKSAQCDSHYDLILLSASIIKGTESDLWQEVQNHTPDIWNKTVVMTADGDSPFENPRFNQLPRVSKPFSLDHFAEVLRKIFVV